MSGRFDPMDEQRLHPSNQNPPKKRLMTRIAAPGDPDLTWDLTGFVVVSAWHIGHEFVIEYEHDEGDGALIVTYGSFEPHQLSDIADVLNRWQVDKTVLRMVAAPDAMSAIIEVGTGDFLPMPHLD